MMHLYAAREAARLQSFKGDAAQYYLGAIAPDSVNLNGFAEKELRWAAHLREKHIPDWYRRIADFYHGTAGRDALTLGYCVHCLTDAAYDRLFVDLVWEKRKESKLADIHKMGVGWDDCMRFDFEQKATPWWTQEVRPALEQSRPARVNTIPGADLGKYKDHILHGYFEGLREGSPLVISAHLVEALGREVSDLMTEYGITI